LQFACPCARGDCCDTSGTEGGFSPGRCCAASLCNIEDTKAGSLTDGNMDTHIIHSRGARSPPPRLDLVTHTKQQTLQQPHGQAEMLGQTSELTPWLSRHHPFGEGHGQARLVLGPEQGMEHGMLPLHATQELQQPGTKPAHGTANAGQHSGYSNSSIHTLYTTEIPNQPMAAARRRQGQQLYPWNGTPNRRLRVRHHSY